MKLTSAQVTQTLNQFPAHVIPDDHPLVPQLSNLFGDYTFFLDNDGLSIVEPAAEAVSAGKQTARSRQRCELECGSHRLGATRTGTHRGRCEACA